MKAVRMVGVGQSLKCKRCLYRPSARATFWFRCAQPASVIRTCTIAPAVRQCDRLPMTLGHEVAGIVQALGAAGDERQGRRPRLFAL